MRKKMRHNSLDRPRHIVLYLLYYAYYKIFSSSEKEGLKGPVVENKAIGILVLADNASIIFI